MAEHGGPCGGCAKSQPLLMERATSQKSNRGVAAPSAAPRLLLLMLLLQHLPAIHAFHPSTRQQRPVGDRGLAYYCCCCSCYSSQGATCGFVSARTPGGSADAALAALAGGAAVGGGAASPAVGGGAAGLSVGSSHNHSNWGTGVIGSHTSAMSRAAAATTTTSTVAFALQYLCVSSELVLL